MSVPGDATLTIRVELAEGLVVGPDEYLLIKVGEGIDEKQIPAMLEHLKAVGLADRTLIFSGDVEISKVAKNEWKQPPEAEQPPTDPYLWESGE